LTEYPQQKRLEELLPGKIRSYQEDGIQFLMERDNALLADEMGLGKTVQVSVALELLWRQNKLNKALIVCPSSLKWNWVYELSRWAPSLSVQKTRGNKADRIAHYMLPYNALVASYEDIRNDFQDFPSSEVYDVVVLDEAQRIKNSSSQTALACGLLPRKKSWALSGTPLENRPDELISIFSFIKFGLLRKGLSKTEIHSRMKDFFIRRRKKEVATELPPIIEQEILLDLSPLQRQAYDEVWITRWERVKQGGERTEYGNMLSIITELKQICNYDPKTEESVKFDALQLVIDSLQNADDKLLIFSQYVKTLRWLDRKIDFLPRELFHGGLSDDERQKSLSKFIKESGPRALLISLMAGGVGLNLQEASTVVMFDRWWNPAIENQAIQRAHRLGRDRPLHVIKYLVRDSIEERINQILHQKQELFNEYVEAAETSFEIPLNGNVIKRLLAE
jgi:SNF2 family DNA or RNA helicase